MFGWKIKEIVPTAQSNILEMLNALLNKIDFTLSNTTNDSITILQREIQNCNSTILQLSNTEQSKVSMYWTSGVMGVINTLDMYNAIPSMKLTLVPSLLPAIRTNILNTINALS